MHFCFATSLPPPPPPGFKWVYHPSPRWDTIAEYINYHVPTANKTAKQVIKVVKTLQQSGMFQATLSSWAVHLAPTPSSLNVFLAFFSDQTLKEAEKKQVFSRFEQEHLNKLQSTAGITERIDGSGEDHVTVV